MVRNPNPFGALTPTMESKRSARHFLSVIQSDNLSKDIDLNLKAG